MQGSKLRGPVIQEHELYDGYILRVKVRPTNDDVGRINSRNDVLRGDILEIKQFRRSLKRMIEKRTPLNTIQHKITHEMPKSLVDRDQYDSIRISLLSSIAGYIRNTFDTNTIHYLCSVASYIQELFPETYFCGEGKPAFWTCDIFKIEQICQKQLSCAMVNNIKESPTNQKDRRFPNKTENYGSKRYVNSCSTEIYRQF